MTKRLLVLLLSIFILASCRIGNSVIVVSTVTPISTALPTATSTVTLTPTQTSTPTVSPDVMSYQCLDIADHPPANYVLKGTLVNNNNDNTDAFLWNNDTKTVYRFPRGKSDRLLQFDVSPDRKYIAYWHASGKTDKLVIATADGQPIWSQIINSYSWNWFDNEHLIGLVVPQDRTPSLFLLNPFTGQRQELRVDYPDSRLFLNDPSDRWRYTNGGLPIYDPTLTRALYPECDTQCQEKLIRGEGGWPIALWDIETNQVIARIETMDSYGDTPFWTPDGKQFILATNVDPNKRWVLANEFFRMSREGQVRQLTHFKDYYKEVDIPDNYRLSPDGKLLAFWIVAQPSQYEGARLAVMNIETGKVTNYCIPTNNPEDPIWSPDGTQLLIVTQDLRDQRIWRMVLVDLVHNYAAQFGDAGIVKPVGWMVSR